MSSFNINLTDELPALLEPKRVARILGSSPKFVRDMLSQGKIKGVKVGGKWFINRDAFLEQFGLVEEGVSHD